MAVVEVEPDTELIVGLLKIQSSYIMMDLETWIHLLKIALHV
jgi:hypothetical protein